MNFTDTDVSMGFELDDSLPLVARELLARTGKNPKHIQIWEHAYSDLVWPKRSLPLLSNVPSSSGALPEVIAFLNECATTVTDQYGEGINSFIYAVSAEKDVLICGVKAYTWSPLGWLEIESEPGQPFAGLIESLTDCHSVILGGDISLWFGDDATNPTFSETSLLQTPERVEFIDALLSEYEWGDEALHMLPSLNGFPDVFIVDSWNGFTLGPISPDPESDFHKLRVLAMRLSVEGFEVNLDWGPFIQNYDEFNESSKDKGVIYITATGGNDECTTSDGSIPVFIVSETKSSHSAVQRTRELAERFNLDLVVY